uniref:Sulfatase modifying factor 2 n=1 Tax=Rousettus aegyptiacus TaxID=9407 RepID=A0A7J8F413_ROUAE|nr:sulfatase modifying factor 2 [Rousettus aegyptiacus]
MDSLQLLTTVIPVLPEDKAREFVREKKYRTEAEMFGWSFILRTLSPMSLETKQLSR